MSELFSTNWMARFKEAWNSEPELSEALGKIGFSSMIGYGFPDEDAPSGYIKVENGQITDAGPYQGEDLNWDLRATGEHWGNFFAKEPSMTGLGLAYTTGKLKFRKGDYAAMLKDPRMATPFVKSFAVMGRV